MTQKELREKVELLIGEEFLEPVHKGLYGYTQSQIAMKKLMQLFQTYQAQDRERIARALEKEKIESGTKHHIGNITITTIADTAYDFHNRAIDKALAIVQGTEEEGDK